MREETNINYQYESQRRSTCSVVCLSHDGQIIKSFRVGLQRGKLSNFSFDFLSFLFLYFI